MKLGGRFKIFLFLVCCTQLVYAKSPCYVLATNTYLNSSLSPAVATRENLQDANEIMANAETFCNRMIQAVKTKKVTADELRVKARDALNAARHDFGQDGEADKLQLAEFMSAILQGSADIAER